MKFKKMRFGVDEGVKRGCDSKMEDRFGGGGRLLVQRRLGVDDLRLKLPTKFPDPVTTTT